VIVIGYACLGLLVGLLTGLTSSPVTTTILASIFTLAGGSIVPVLAKSESDRRILGSVLASFALLCLAGVLTGVYIKVNELLTDDSPPTAQTIASRSPERAVTYLKGVDLDEFDAINVAFRNRDIDANQAYTRLWERIEAVRRDSK
jgi:hypothetical protein